MGVSSNIKRFIDRMNAGQDDGQMPGVSSSVRRYVAWLAGGSNGARPYIGANV